MATGQPDLHHTRPRQPSPLPHHPAVRLIAPHHDSPSILTPQPLRDRPLAFKITLSPASRPHHHATIPAKPRPRIPSAPAATESPSVLLTSRDAVHPDMSKGHDLRRHH